MLTRRGSIVVLGCIAGLAGCRPRAAEESPRQLDLAYITNGIASFWVIAQAGAEAAATDLGVRADVRMPAEGTIDQQRIIEDLITRGVDGIAISPIDPANQTEIINEACRHTLVITQDSDAPQTDRLCYIGMDNYHAGRLCGELVKEAIPGGGKIMICVGRLEQHNARLRRQGVIDEVMDRAPDPTRYDPPGDVVSNDRYTILGTLTDQFDRDKAKANAEDTIARHPDIACMVGLFAYNPPLILEALDRAGKLGAIEVVGFDEADATLQGIKEGTVHGTVVQNPFLYGYASIELLAKLARGDATSIPENKFIDIPARFIRRDNVEEFWADLKAKLGQK